MSPRHSLSVIRPDARLATCAVCGPDSPIRFKAHKSRWACQTSDSRRSPEAKHRHHLQLRFGISEQEYAALLATQSAVCAICEEPCSGNRRLAVDHDHESGRIRGLLCNRCNRALGLLRDRPELLLRAVSYLNN